jgi:hypothetical protein
MAKKLLPPKSQRIPCSISFPTTETKPRPRARLLARRKKPSQVARARVAKSNLPKPSLCFRSSMHSGSFWFGLYVQKAGGWWDRKARYIDTLRVYSTSTEFVLNRRQILGILIMFKTITITPLRSRWLLALPIQVVGKAIQCKLSSKRSVAPG